jgi:hypothetical protein
MPGAAVGKPSADTAVRAPVTRAERQQERTPLLGPTQGIFLAMSVGALMWLGIAGLARWLIG